jgi:hypothetical protein
MLNLSIPQAIDIYDELVRAYYGKNGFGTDTAEIYAHRLVPANPTAEAAYRNHNNIEKGGLLWNALMEQGQAAADNLFAIIDRFQQKYPNAKVRFEDFRQDGDADEGISKTIWVQPRTFLRKPLFHRCHVRVESPENGKD